MFGAARPVVVLSATAGLARPKKLQDGFCVQHPILSHRWQPNSRWRSWHRAESGSVLTPTRRHQTHVELSLGTLVVSDTDLVFPAPGSAAVDVDVQLSHGIAVEGASVNL